MQAKSLYSKFLQEAGVKEITVVIGGPADVVFTNGLSVLYPSVEAAAAHAFRTDVVSLALEMGKAARNEQFNVLEFMEAA